jgi:hypothetical protein
MRDELSDQLRRYGEGLERSMRSVEPGGSSTGGAASGRRRWSRGAYLVAALAAAVVLVTIGVAVLAADDDSVTTAEGSPVRPVPTRPPAFPTTTSSSASVITVEGTATWVGGPDPRASLRVGACRAGSQDCTPVLFDSVGPDGAFRLEMRAGSPTEEWTVAAYVALGDFGCVMNCVAWRGAQVGPTVTVSLTDPPAGPVELSVSARVIDVYVRDRDGNPFEGGGVLVADARCPDDGCEGEFARMFSDASGVDGLARIVVDPTISYHLHGQAMNTGWPNPELMIGTNTFWKSEEVILRGAEIDDGQVFLVNGGPSEPSE